MAAWPGNLPQYPLLNSYSTSRNDGRVITKVQQGAPRVRLLYANTPREFTASYTMTLAQWATFDAFYYATLAGGTLTVDLPLLTPSGLGTVEVLILKVGAQKMLSSEMVGFTLTVIEA